MLPLKRTVTRSAPERVNREALRKDTAAEYVQFDRSATRRVEIVLFAALIWTDTVPAMQPFAAETPTHRGMAVPRCAYRR